MSACYCIGPQNGQPLCPCRMKSVQVLNGRYVQVIDLGPTKYQGLEVDQIWFDDLGTGTDPLKFKKPTTSP